MLTDWIFESELLAGGWIMAAILLLSCVMWVLILDRYLFLYYKRPKLTRQIRAQWHEHRSDNVLVNRRLRMGLTSSFHGKLSEWLGTITVITAILPLLGLLGTVTGMIKTFEVLTVFGNGNVRGMAEGISQALITTMGGLLTAVTGMYFASDLRGRMQDETEKLNKHLAER